SFPSSDFLQLQGALAFGPVAHRILDELTKLDLAFGNRRDKAEILAHVVADFDAVQARIGFDQRKIRLPLLQHAHLLPPFQRISFEWFLRPVQIGLESAAAAAACPFSDELYVRAPAAISLI